MTKSVVASLCLLLSATAFSQFAESSNDLGDDPEYGPWLEVYDFRPETLEFMNDNRLQGGGPTWVALITAALELKSPKTLRQIEFDDSGDMVLIYAESTATLKTVQSLVAELQSKREFMITCMKRAEARGYLE